MIQSRRWLDQRGLDPMGSGHYKASRGTRQHRGVDFLCNKGEEILSPCAGQVTRIGLPYANEHYRYVEITDDADHRIRIFYVHPLVGTGQLLNEGEPIGFAQSINERHSSSGQTYRMRGMQNHIHIEVKQRDGSFINPALVLAGPGQNL